ncbi:MAG: peptidoglycan DD-metalloendopeptidase family protein [Methylococcaceae bacterium]|nr:peptidoglycan DD-metalloendopeptidase family protein [Methylococcaceae bacterium]
MNLKRLLVFVLVISHVFCLETIAGDIAKKTTELTGLQAKIKQISRSVSNLKTKKNSLLTELKKLDTQYGKSAVILRRLDDQANKLKHSIARNRQQIQKKQQQINSQKHDLENQVKAAYGMGRNERIKLILNQQNPSLSGRMMVYYDYLNKARLKKIARIDEDMQALHDLELEHLKETTVLEDKLEKRKREQSVFLQTKIKHQTLLAKIKKQVFSKKQQLGRFKLSEKKLKSLIYSLQQTLDDFPFEDGGVKEFAKLKGKLAWPVKGSLLKKFGAQRSGSHWDGVLIKAKEGADIRVVTRGRVVFADWLRGYGLLTIIDHGKGYMTLYAFNQSLYKTVGDWVEAGAVIATVGKSGGQSTAGLYFGIRKKGKPVNPVKWCRKIRHGKVG